MLECRAINADNSSIETGFFKKAWTKYDRLPSKEEFRRYEKRVISNNKSVKITIDFFVRNNVPSNKIEGWSIVDPKYLLTLYTNIHSSDKCFAVKAAKILIDKGINPIGMQELVDIPKHKDIGIL